MNYRQPFRGTYPISQRYGELIEGVTYKNRPHTGIDYECPFGTEVLASADGTVVYSGYEPSGYGNYITILHEKRKATLYAHLSERKVWVNQKVKQGQVIGLSGSSGNSTGPHLHFEARKVWNNWTTHQDPERFLPLMCVDEGQGARDQGQGNQTLPVVGNQTLPVGGNQTPSQAQGSDSLLSDSILATGSDSILKAGVYRVVCEAAFVRGWEKLNREKQVYRGEPVYLFGQVKYLDGLPFYFCGAGSCMAAYDYDGTTILEKVEDGEEEH